MALEHVLPHPTGAGATRASGGREHQEQPRRSLVLREPGPELLQARQLHDLARWSGRLTRGGAPTAREHTRDENDESYANHAFSVEEALSGAL
jgi:hypothetical protein